MVAAPQTQQVAQNALIVARIAQPPIIAEGYREGVQSNRPQIQEPSGDGPVTRRVLVNGIEIAYESFGDPTDPALLLIMGLGTQMIAWPDQMCEDLAKHGHYVVRFDNRDVGLSTHLQGVRAPAPRDILLRRAKPPYTMHDLADDAAGLMTALDIGSAHVVGASMGGFIAQHLALRYPKRVDTLTLMMTSTGSRRVGLPKPELLRRLTQRRSLTDRTSAQDYAVDTYRAIGSPGFPFDEARLRDLAGRSYDRAHDPAGYLRQLAAVLAQPNRTDRLRRLDLPVLVMHGLNDPLVNPSGGLALARTIRRARFVGFAGMGHDLPRALWPDMVRQITALSTPN